MSGVNKVIIIGNLGSDPELRYSGNNQAVATLRVATNEVWTDREGNRQERTEWHRIVLFGKQAELARDYLKKGRQVYVEGRLQTREWQDKDNNRRFTTEIVGQTMQFLGGGEGRGRGGMEEPPPPTPEDYGYPPERGWSAPPAPPPPARPAAGSEGVRRPPEQTIVEDDDIPF